MGNCIYNKNIKLQKTQRHVYFYEPRPQPQPQSQPQPQLQPQSDELQVPDFVSEQSDYDAFIRFHKYPEDVILRSDILCHRVEVAREQLLWNEIQFVKVKRAIRYLVADIDTVHQIDALNPCEHSFGINPLSILESQLEEQQHRLNMYRSAVNHYRQQVDHNYASLMRFWDKEYTALCRGEK